MKAFVILIVGIVVGMLCLSIWQRGAVIGEGPEAHASESSKSGNDIALPPSSVLNINPKASAPASSKRANGTAMVSQTLSPALSDYLARRDFPNLYRKLLQTPGDAEALFLRAQLLERCGQIQGVNTPKRTLEERCSTFAASLNQKDADFAQRLAAFDQLNRDPCGDLRSVQTSLEELNALRAQALALKDPAAAARELNCETYGSIDRANGGRFPEVNDSRFEQIRSAMSSRNPIAVRTGIGMLANTYRNGNFQIGPTSKPVDPNLMAHVANVVACQYGGDCTLEVLRACANDGKCGVTNYDDLLAYHQLSPSDAQIAEQYRVWLTQMIETNDFSQLLFNAGEQTTDSVRIASYFSCDK